MSTALSATRSRTAASTLVAGGLLTLASGLVVQAIVIPATDVSDGQFSYPWSPGMLIPVSVL